MATLLHEKRRVGTVTSIVACKHSQSPLDHEVRGGGSGERRQLRRERRGCCVIKLDLCIRNLEKDDLALYLGKPLLLLGTDRNNLDRDQFLRYSIPGLEDATV